MENITSKDILTSEGKDAGTCRAEGHLLPVITQMGYFAIAKYPIQVMS